MECNNKKAERQRFLLDFYQLSNKTIYNSYSNIVLYPLQRDKDKPDKIGDQVELAKTLILINKRLALQKKYNGDDGIRLQYIA